MKHDPLGCVVLETTAAPFEKTDAVGLEYSTYFEERFRDTLDHFRLVSIFAIAVGKPGAGRTRGIRRVATLLCLDCLASLDMVGHS